MSRRTFLSHDDLNARGFKKSRVGRWRDVRNRVFPRPVSIGLANVWSDDVVDYYSELLIAGFSRLEATAMCETRCAEQRRAILAKNSEPIRA
jgi:hypothetical protein